MLRTSRAWIVNGLLLAAFAALGLKAVDEPNNDFRFAIIGDRTGGAQPQIYGRVWREVDLLHPDFVINVGDTIEGGDDAEAADEWREMRPLWARYNHYPLYFTPGNHDIWSDVSRQLYEQESSRPTRYGFDYQDAHFTVLDSAATNGSPYRGELGPDELAFLEKDLEENADAEPKFVFFHHPTWIRPLAAGEPYPLHDLLRKYGVDYVITGHGHQFVRRVHEGIVYMEVGSSGGQMIGGLMRGEGFGEGRFYHWVTAHVRNGKVRMTVKEIGGQWGDGRMFPAEDWDENGPNFNIADPALSYDPET